MNNVLNWLLEDENPIVKYRTMTELLDISKDEAEVKKVYNNLLSSKTVSLIMDRFKLNTKWDDVTALIALAEFGLTRNDVSTDDYIERIIKCMSLKYMKCTKTLLLRNLVLLGYYEHEWVKEQIFSSFSTIRAEVPFDAWTRASEPMTLSYRIWGATGKLPLIFCSRQR